MGKHAERLRPTKQKLSQNQFWFGIFTRIADIMLERTSFESQSIFLINEGKDYKGPRILAENQ